MKKMLFSQRVLPPSEPCVIHGSSRRSLHPSVQAVLPHVGYRTNILGQRLVAATLYSGALLDELTTVPLLVKEFGD
jgi:hypothetical protein